MVVLHLALSISVAVSRLAKHFMYLDVIKMQEGGAVSDGSLILPEPTAVFHISKNYYKNVANNIMVDIDNSL